MQTGYILFFFAFPTALKGCCPKNQEEKRKAATGLTGLQQATMHHHYRAVEGESFMMPCIKSVEGHVVWSRTRGGGGENEGPSFNCSTKFPVEAKHSGNYTCLTCGSKLFLHLEVVKHISLECIQPNETRAKLFLITGGKIHCPGHNCSDNTDVRWYKDNTPVTKLHDTCEKNGLLHFCDVRKFHAGVYFCDRQINKQGAIWTFRRTVQITVEPLRPPDNRPRIVNPADQTQEVELGQPHNLTCQAFFSHEEVITAEVQWYVNIGGNKETITRLPMEKPEKKQMITEEYGIIGRSIIKEVTLQHLNHTYTCIANNSAGHRNVTIKLKEKIKVKWPPLVGFTIVTLLLVSGLGIVLHVKWLELQLIYKSHFQRGKHDEDEKEFDVFLSYVWSPPSVEVGGGWTLSSRSGPDSDEEACLSSIDPLSTEEGEATCRPLEVLLPQVLEEQWGYRLCLPERDILPGGAYTNEVVLAIQRSQMLICLLSADYLCNSDAVFVLESGVQALLQKSAPKLLLIWTSRESASFIQQEPPLPTLVRSALKVLPSLKWTSSIPDRATCNFWRSLRKAMPNHRVKLVSLIQA